MASFLVFDVTDTEGRVSPMRLRIEDQTVPADVTTLAAAIATAAFGTTKPSMGGVSDVRLEIDSVHAPIGVYGACDIRDNWQLSMEDGDGFFYRLGVPSRNLLSTLIASGSKTLGDLSIANWTGLNTALTAGVIHTENPKSGATADAIAKAIASVRGRKRPREGGSR